jgi:hypothetical protein
VEDGGRFGAVGVEVELEEEGVVRRLRNNVWEGVAGGGGELW